MSQQADRYNLQQKWDELPQDQRDNITKAVEVVKTKIKEKQRDDPDFQRRIPFDPDILFDTNHPQFSEHYQESDELKDEVWKDIRIRRNNRNALIGASFLGYHAAKTVLWRYGYFAHFFYRTRLLSIPIVMGAVWYSTTKKYATDLQEAGIFEYSVKNFTLWRHRDQVAQIFQLKADLSKENEKNQQVLVDINNFINTKKE